MGTNRRLAAIMFTDIVGYTALMQGSESVAIDIVKRHRDSLNSCVEQHSGEIIQFYGDGSLSLFSSAYDAVRCARDLQLVSQSGQISVVPLRIGLHIGEVTFSDDGVFGDGVNIASRIESLGVAGSVLFSRSVYNKVANQEALQIEPLGKFNVKNVSDPVEVFALADEGLVVPKRGKIDGKQRDKNDRRILYSVLGVLVVIAAMFTIYTTVITPAQNAEAGNLITLAVLDFENESEQGVNGYLSTSIPSVLIEKLSGCDQVRVPPNSSVKYYSRENELTSVVAKKLNVRYIIEGSIRETNASQSVYVELIDTEASKVLWARPFKIDETNLMYVNQEIVRSLFDQLDIEETADVVIKEGTENNEAYVLHQKGKVVSLRGSRDDFFQAIDFFKQSLEHDSLYLDSYVEQAACYACLAGYYGGYSSAEARKNAMSLIDKAFSIDPDYAPALQALALVKWWLEWDYEGALDIYRSLGGHVSILMQAGDYTGAMEIIVEERKAQPLDPWLYYFEGTVNYLMGNEARAIEVYNEALALFPDQSDLHWEGGRVYIASGDFHRGIEVLERGIAVAGWRPPNMLAYLAIGHWNLDKKDETMTGLSSGLNGHMMRMNWK